MKKLLLLAAAALMAFCAAAQNSEDMKAKKVLVAYFSATGTTEEVAKMIAAQTGGDLVEITPEQAYTSADLNWNNKSSRSSVEMHDASSRPAIVKNLEGAGDYDVVYIGYPIWWNEAPRAVNTFIEAYDFTGKTMVPFATSGGSSINNSVSVLKRTYPKLTWSNGRLLNYASEDEIAKFVK